MLTEEFADTPIFYEEELVNEFIPKTASYEYLQLPKLSILNDKQIASALENALDHPIKTKPLKELIDNQNKSVIILVDDNTRPNIHTRKLLPLIEEKLINYGVLQNNIKIIVATGTHTPPTQQEVIDRILGDLYKSWENRIFIHNCDNEEDHIYLGKSEIGTPISIDSRVFNSDIIIPLSDSEYHYFAGVAGSVKLILPGVSSRKTVRVNHSTIFDMETGFKVNCRMGNIKDSPSIQDSRKIVKTLQEKHKKIVLVIDAILVNGEFINIFAGEPLSIHSNALSELSAIRNAELSKRGDIVIIGKPSVNYYQAGKAVNAGSHAVKDGGSIVVLSGCPDGIGPDDYFETMKFNKDKPFKEAMQWVIKHKCSDQTFEIGIQNAVDLFRVLQLTKDNVYLYSGLDTELMRENFHVKPLNTAMNPQLALREFIRNRLKNNPEAHIVIFEDFNLLAVKN